MKNRIWYLKRMQICLNVYCWIKKTYSIQSKNLLQNAMSVEKICYYEKNQDILGSKSIGPFNLLYS